MTTVVAGLIWESGRVLACRRRAEQVHGGKWEFPGGKLEPGETPPEALRRELREELRIDANVGAEITRYEFSYPEKEPILLIFHEVRGYVGRLDGEFFAETRWLPPARLQELDFLEGDIEFVQGLARGEFSGADRQA